MRTTQDVRDYLLDEIADVRTPIETYERAIVAGRSARRRRRAIGGGVALAAAAAIVVPTALLPLHGGAGVATSSTPKAAPLAGDLPAYAVGATITDGDLTVRAPGPVTQFAKSDGRYVVTWHADDGRGSRVSVVAPDGEASAPVAYNVSSGPMITGTVNAEPIVTVGSGPVYLVSVATSSTTELPTDGWVVGVVPDGVVVVDSAYGVPTVWTESGGSRPLIDRDVTTVAVGAGAVIVHDPVDHCSLAIDIGAPENPLWVECDVSALSKPTPGVLSSDGRWISDGARVIDAKTGSTQSTLGIRLADGQAVSTTWTTAGTLAAGGSAESGTRLASIYTCDAFSGRCTKTPLPASSSVVFAGEPGG